MPLMHKKSKKAFKENVEAEMDAGKPQDQSLAIAYNVQRQSKKAHGGMMKPQGVKYGTESSYSEGGMAEPSNSMTLAEMIRHKMSKYADGGQVDLEKNNAEESPNEYYNINENLDDLYEEPNLDEHVMSGDSHGNEDVENVDDHSIVSRIRAKAKKR